MADYLAKASAINLVHLLIYFPIILAGLYYGKDVPALYWSAVVLLIVGGVIHIGLAVKKMSYATK